MSLRKKILFGISAMAILSTVILFLAFKIIIEKSFSHLEEEFLQQNMTRILNVIQDDTNNLETFTWDWASWDDTYAFVEDLNQEYIQSNLVDGTFSSANLNLALYLNTSKQIVYSKGFDLESEEEIELPTELLNHISTNELLAHHSDPDSSVCGIAILLDEPTLLCSLPILTSEDEGPVAGTLIFGRYITPTVSSEWSERLDLDLTVTYLDDIQTLTDLYLQKAVLSDEKSIRKELISEDTIAGYILINDIQGKPAMTAKVEMPRIIYSQGLITLRYIIAASTLFGWFISVTSVILFQKFLFSRLTNLNRDVNQIAEKGDQSARVSVIGSDELADLAQRINVMLEALEESQMKLRIEAQNRIFLDAIPNPMFRIRRDGTIIDYRFSEGVRHFSPWGTPEGIEMDDTEGEFIQHLLAKVLEIGSPYLQRTLDTDLPESFEFQLHLEDDVRDYEACVVVSGADEGLVIARDVTDRKQAEEAERRGLLLKEIHHRVKNNLQVISSLLNLYAHRVSDQKTVDMLKNTQSQIRSIGLIHEKLYQSKDFSGINFADYIQDLITYLFNSTKTDTSNIKLALEIENCFLSMDTAIPCGLIIHELVMNSLKHAFPNGKDGEIHIQLHKLQDQSLSLIVADNGVGMPQDYNHDKSTSLGLQLVSKLVEQLRGTMDLDREGGTKYKINFSNRS